MAAKDRDITLCGASDPTYAEILTPEAINFVAALARRFRPSLEQLLAKRVRVQAAYDSGEQKLDFNPQTQDIRDRDWQVRTFWSYCKENAQIKQQWATACLS